MKDKHVASGNVGKKGLSIAKPEPVNLEDKNAVMDAICKLREIRETSQPGPTIRDLIDDGRKV